MYITAGMNNIVHKHTAFFSDDGVSLNAKTMCQRHYDMGICPYVPLKVEAILNIGDSVTEIASTSNPSSTGLWRADGSFDIARFDMLRAKAITVDGVDYLLRAHFDSLRTRDRDDEVPTHVSLLFGCVPYGITWKAITDGSLRELFEYFGQTIVVDGSSVRAIRVDTALAFYLNPVSEMTRLIDSRK